MRRAVIAAVLSVGVIAVGAAPADGATRAEYITQVDPICQSTNDAMSHAAKGLQQDKKARRFKVAARKLRAQLAIFGPAVEQIAALDPPVTDAPLIANWVQMLRSQVPVVKHLAKDYAQGHLRTKAYFRLGSLITKTEALVASFGFHSCQDL